MFSSARPTSSPERPGRMVEIADVASALESRLYGPTIDEEQLAAGCRFAASAGLAAVTCRPDAVKNAAGMLADSGVGVVSAVAFGMQRPMWATPAALAAEGRALVRQGATEVAFVVAPDEAGVIDDTLIGRQIRSLTEACGSVGGRVRVHIECEQLSDRQLAAACHLAVEAGAHLVQGGSYLGDKADFSQIELMRQAIERPVVLKWTWPVRSLEMMLVAMGMGVDRFNGDPPGLLRDTRTALRLGPLVVPQPGIDF